MAILGNGQVINRFTVVSFSHKDTRHRKFYLVRCICEKEKIINGALLVSGNTKSCGCLSMERKKAQRLPGDKGMVNQIILQIKRHAKSRGLAWLLSFETVDELIRQPCYYCGDQAGNLKINRHNPSGFAYNRLDRVNSKQGYCDGNVVPCCRKCNTAKSNMTLEEFREWALRLCAMATQWGNP